MHVGRLVITSRTVTPTAVVSSIGESALKGPMPYDTINAATFEKQSRQLFKQELKERSQARVASEKEFQWIQEDIERGKKRIAENKVSLNEKTRRAELDEDKARREAHNAERTKVKSSDDLVYSVTLDNAAKPALEPTRPPPPMMETFMIADLRLEIAD